jgi:chaperonin GroES
MKLKPLGDNVVVKQAEAEQKTKSGFIIPDTAQEKPTKGTVIAVGEGKFEKGARVPIDVKVGDTVIYSKYGGTDVKIDDVEYKILHASDIYAIVE